MRTTKYLLSTLRQAPTNTETISQELMFRTGMIRKLSSGIYSWLPTGLRVLNNIKNIIRKEMIKIGAIELLMPVLQPINLWQKSGRLEQYGTNLMKTTNRNRKTFILGPTHEEVISYIVRNESDLYNKLPIIFFQIQTKFRDEIRARYGTIRSREFIMKDAYSFHFNDESLKQIYKIMYDTYIRIFKKMNINFCITQADNGIMGGNISHEFYALNNSSNNNIDIPYSSNYANSTNIKKMKTLDIKTLFKKKLYRITISDQITSNPFDILNISKEKTVKIIIVQASNKSNHKMVALLLRGDHTLSVSKVEKIDIIAKPLIFSSKIAIKNFIDVNCSFIGPIGLNLPIIADYETINMNNFYAGANINGVIYGGINWERDLPIPYLADISNITKSSFVLNRHSLPATKHNIEIGHIFQLGKKYCVNNSLLNKQNNNNKSMIMGCYGIGITRLIPAIIEQNHDKYGILWNEDIAPFQVAILAVDIQKSSKVRYVSENLYKTLYNIGIDVIFDDREESFGTKITDIELIGIPHILIVSDHSIENNNVEYRYRRSNHERKILKIYRVTDFLKRKLSILKRTN